MISRMTRRKIADAVKNNTRCWYCKPERATLSMVGKDKDMMSVQCVVTATWDTQKK